jgi:uncharacterized protein (TIGR00299 family) protein
MKVIQFDSVGGASGDLILGALIDLGVDAAALERTLSSLHVGHFHLLAEPHASHGLRGTRVMVDAHEHHGHHHGHEHGHAHGHEHSRNLADIEKLVGSGDLPAAVQERAMAVFRRIGEAEAHIHGTTLDKIHFHEVGAVDSIVDIVGCCLALHELGVDAVAVGPLPQGQGTIRCQHGVYPNPAPATLALLKDMPVSQTTEPYELVTPTGAALLSTWRNLEALPQGSRPVRTGHGFGHHVLHGRPNLLRATLYETGGSNPAEDRCLVLECNIDDATPEIVGALAERVLQAGALDVFTVSAQMKKQRPGMLFTVLCRPDDRERMLDLIFRESTTFGVREHMTTRTVLDRRWETVNTPYGQVRIKIGTWRGADVTLAPEMDDCLAAAKARGAPVRVVYEAAAAAAQHLRRNTT